MSKLHVPHGSNAMQGTRVAMVSPVILETQEHARGGETECIRRRWSIHSLVTILLPLGACTVSYTPRAADAQQYPGCTCTQFSRRQACFRRVSSRYADAVPYTSTHYTPRFTRGPQYSLLPPPRSHGVLFSITDQLGGLQHYTLDSLPAAHGSPLAAIRTMQPLFTCMSVTAMIETRRGRR
jgi:hypothetical protein